MFHFETNVIDFLSFPIYTMNKFYLGVTNVRPIRLLAIAPYEGLAEILKSISSNRSDIHLTVETGDLQTGVEIAREHINEQFDAIISRGGTADLLRSKVHIPVIEISISVYDVLRAIKMAENYQTTFAIAGFSTITDCAKLLCDLLQYDIEIVTFKNKDEVRPVLSRLKQQGFDLVLCDMIGSTVAGEMNLNNILISSGSESVESSLTKAIQLVRSLSLVNKQKEVFKYIITNSKHNFIVYDGSGDIWFSNIVDNDIESLIYHYLEKYSSVLFSSDNKNVEEIVNGNLLTFTSQWIHYEEETYTSIRIMRTKLSQQQEGAYTVYNASAPSSALEVDSSSANYIGFVRQEIEKYSGTRYPVAILGEKGTGKDKAASTLYRNGPFSDHPMYTINCVSLTTEQWNALLEEDSSPLYAIETTLFFKEINALTHKQLEELKEVINKTNLTKRNRLLFSFLLGQHANHSAWISYLKEELGCLQLNLPPLRKRREELPSIITLYLNKLNTNLGKQIIGLKADAMSLMLEFSWPQNLNQLYRVMKELVILEHSYISKETVQRVLEKEQYVPEQTEDTSTIDLNKTLDEITYDIIQMILKEEGGNKERTAARLGIGRSTLWRRLNAYSDHS